MTTMKKLLAFNKSRMACLMLAAALILAGLTAMPAQAAGLEGSSVQGYYYFPCDSCLYGNFSYTTNPFTVGAGSESTLQVDSGNALVDVDFSAFSLVLTHEKQVGFNGCCSFNGPEFKVLSGND